MTKKTVRRSRSSAARRAPTQPSHSNVVRAGRDLNVERFVGRDLISTVNETNFHGAIDSITNRDKFIDQLLDLQRRLDNLKEENRLSSEKSEDIDIVKADLQRVTDEARQPKPLPDRMSAVLTTAKATMDDLGQGLQSAVSLGTIIAGLIQLVKPLFGG